MKKRTETEKVAEKAVCNSALVNAWFRRLPWLEKYFSRSAISDVKLTSLNGDLLARSVEFYSDGGVPWPNYTILLFDKDAGLMGQVGKREVRYTRKKYIFFGKSLACLKTLYFSELVRQSMNRLRQDGRQIHYIVGKESHCDKKTLFITCPPKGSSFDQILAEEKEKADMMVQQSLEALSS